MHAYRSHTCGQLRKSDVGETVRLSGWVHRKREHANALFIDLRDHYGISQVVVYPTASFYEDLKRCTSCLLYTSPSPRDATLSRMPSSA